MVLTTLDLVIAFAVIMTVLSLLITVGVQMISAALSLRGKNLANAVALTFQSIDPQIGEQAYLLADHILKDPVLSDSLFQPKSRPQVNAPTLLRAVAAEQAKIVEAISGVQATLARTPETGEAAPASAPAPDSVAPATPLVDSSWLSATTQHADEARNTLRSIEKKVMDATRAARDSAPVSPGLKARKAPWGFIHWSDLKFFSLRNPDSACHLATAVRPGEVYRLLGDLSVLSDDEAKQRGFADLNRHAADLLKMLGVPEGPALEAREKLVAIGKLADLFSTPEQKKAVLDSLDTLGLTVEKAAAQSYDHFQRWFGSAQDRAEQWFQAQTRNVTIVLGLVLAVVLQVDTVEIFHQLRDSPGLVQMLVKSAPATLETGGAVIGPADRNVLAGSAYLDWRQRHPLYPLAALPPTGSFTDYQAAVRQRLQEAPDDTYALNEFAAACHRVGTTDTSGAVRTPADGSTGTAGRAYQLWVEEFPAYPLDAGVLAGLDRSSDDIVAMRARLDQQLRRDGEQENADQGRRALWLDEYKQLYFDFNQGTYDILKHQLDQTGYDLVPDPLFHRWAAQPWGGGVSWWRHFLPHGAGMLITAALLTLGAPFWFNLLKNLMSLRPAVATLIEKRPRSAPALPQAPSNPPPSS